MAASGPLPGVERPKRPPPPKVRPQRPPPPAPISFHSTDGAARSKGVSHVSPKRHSSSGTRFSRMEQGNPLFSAMNDEDDLLDENPVDQGRLITDPLGCRTWEEPVVDREDVAEDVRAGVQDGTEENEDTYRQSTIAKEESMIIPAEARSSDMMLSASLDSLSSDSDDLFQSINNTMFPDPDYELTEYPIVGGELQSEAIAPDVELTANPVVGGKLQGGLTSGETERATDYIFMPFCEDYYASNTDPSSDFDDSRLLEEVEDDPQHKDSTHIESSQPLTHFTPEEAVPKQPAPAPSPAPLTSRSPVQSEVVSPLEDSEVPTDAPVKGRAEGTKDADKLKVPVQDVLNAMRKDLKAKDPSRVDKEGADEPPLSWSLMLGIALTNYFYLCFGYSSFLSGFLTGMYVFFLLLAGLIGFLSYYEVMKRDLLEKLRMEVEKGEREELGSLSNLKLNALPPLKSELFTVAYSYDYSLRQTSVTHPIRIAINDLSLRIETEAASVMGSEVSRRFWQYGEDRTIQERNAIMREVQMTNCHVSLAPDEVAKDRKRRWNKKYPIRLHIRSGEHQECILYLFVKVARDKEEWYRRMWNACRGTTTVDLATQQTKFYHYISKYMPNDAYNFSALKQASRRMAKKKSTQQMQLSQLSHRERNDEGTSVDAPIAGKQTAPRVALSGLQSGRTQSSSTKGVGMTTALAKSYQDRGVQDQAKGPLPSRPTLDRSPKKPSTVSASPPVATPDVISLGMPPELSLNWVNVLAARLCWDFWHEEKWRQWAMQKIDKKLRRLQRPSFLEELHVTDVQVGNDMPRIKQITSQPRINHRGVWAHMEITYKGTFTMTIETRVKSTALLQEKGVSLVSGAANPSQQQGRGASFSLHHYGSASVNDVDTDSDNDEPVADIFGGSDAAEQPLGGSPRTARRLGRLRGYVSSAWKKAANSKLARHVTEKVLSYPLVLQVEVKSLHGHLVVNIPPPPSDSIWYGFERKPYLLLSAKPKLFNRQISFSYVTDWIEKRLIELVEKKVVQPNMLDLTVTALNSGFPEDISSSTTIV